MVGKKNRFKSEFIISWPDASSTVNQFQQIGICHDPNAVKQKVKTKTDPRKENTRFSYHFSRFSFPSTICGFF
jgi:hypothetical protein